MSKKKSKDFFQPKTIYDLQAEICSALANPVRLEILDLIAAKEMTASELLEIVAIPKANMSQHLTVLKDAGIIKARKEGLYQYMTLSIPKIKDACSLIRTVLMDRITIEEKLNSDLIKELKAKR